jgi:hypothetical protein
MRRRATLRMTCAYVRAVKPGVAVAEVFGHFVQRAAFVEKQRCAGVAEVVAAEVRDAGALERGDPDAAAPVVSAEVAALAVREDELVRLGRPRAR